MWNVFEADSGNQLWANVLAAVRSSEVADPQVGRGGPTREILHAALTLRNPRDRWITNRRPALNIAFALAELVWILAGRQDAKFLTYFNRSLIGFVGDGAILHGAYGQRLRLHFGLDQLERVYQALSANPQSRQIVLQIWDPLYDLPNPSGQPRDPDIPCNTQSILKLRHQRLEWLQIMRSNDVYLGLPHNLIQFTFLQEVISGWLAVEPGHYHHVSDSLHLYERDADAATVSGDDEPIEGDIFSIPKSESDAAFARLAAAIDKVTDDRCGILEISRLPDQIALPQSYRDMLCVLCAEGLRRRRQSDLGDQVMTTCVSPIFRRMWSNWQARVKCYKK